jgi:hypothetical protein
VSDIVERLRAWVYTDALYATAREAADEIERLRNGAVESRETVQLTDAEREAVEDAVSRYIPGITPRAEERAATLRSLLSRTGSIGVKTGDDASECHANREKLPERDRLTDEDRPLGDPEIAGEILRLRVAELEDAIRRLPTLTDEERKALTEASEFYTATRTGLALRGLLERLSNPPAADRP